MSVCVLNNSLSGAQPKRAKFAVVALATGAAQGASATPRRVTKATFYGYKALSDEAAPTNNSGAVLLGYVDPTSATTLTAPFLHSIAAGANLTIEQSGSSFDLADISLLGATGDKVFILYWE